MYSALPYFFPSNIWAKQRTIYAAKHGVTGRVRTDVMEQGCTWTLRVPRRLFRPYTVDVSVVQVRVPFFLILT